MASAAAKFVVTVARVSLIVLAVVVATALPTLVVAMMALAAAKVAPAIAGVPGQFLGLNLEGTESF